MKDYIEDNFGDAYEQSDAVAGHFGISDSRALMVVLITEMKTLNFNLSQIDFSLREGRK
jgi:hypothetical protein